MAMVLYSSHEIKEVVNGMRELGLKRAAAEDWDSSNTKKRRVTTKRNNPLTDISNYASNLKKAKAKTRRGIKRRRCCQWKLILQRKWQRTSLAPRAFRFEASWAQHTDFLAVVGEGWAVVEGNPGNRVQELVAQLENCKETLVRWSKTTFPNFRKAIEMLKGKLDRLNIGTLSEQTVKEAETLTKQLEETWSQEEIYWWQKSRVSWLKCGDKNSKFFHNSVIQRRQRNKILRLKDEGGLWLEEREEINKAFDVFYRKLFDSMGPRPMEQALAYVDKVVTDEENYNLMRPVSNLEIEEAVFQIGSNKAPGLDGYTTLFYQTAWKEIATEISGAFTLKFPRVQLISNMPNDYKIDIGRHGFKEEPEVRILPSKLLLDEEANAVRGNLIGNHEQEKISTNNYSTNAERRALSDRFLKADKAALGYHDVHVEEEERRLHRPVKKSGPLLSGTAYCISSCSMIMLNKIVLSSYNFNAGISLMFYQNLISTLIVVLLGLSGTVSVEKLNWKLVRVWIPVNLIFIGMLVSGMYSLKNINIAMVTVLKNVTNIITAIGELYLFQKGQNPKVWTALFLMIISAISGGITDLSFDAVGYAWQIINCILTASYSLTLRWVMDEAKKSTKSGSLNEVSMVLLNNLLSLPFAIILIFLLGEWDYVIHVEVIKLPMFWVFATASGLLGLSISFTSMWFLHQTGPTTYSLVGSLNKIPISIAGIIAFKVPLSLSSLFSILFGLFAGVFFARAKMSR
ncbi:hypothetical protein K1719_019795 [Acacia pycnantha]|nr:hypothetical protein K1719_019795 [Acacia pycnantha]